MSLDEISDLTNAIARCSPLMAELSRMAAARNAPALAAE